MIKLGRRPKNRYEQMLSEYLRRREVLKSKSQIMPYARYVKQRKRLNARISHMKRQIGSFNKKLDFLNRLYRFTLNYFGIDPKNNGKRSPKSILARDIFFRYGLEHGINGPILNEFLGFSRTTKTALVSRKRVMKTQENKDIYKAFCKFVFGCNGWVELEIKRRYRKTIEAEC